MPERQCKDCGATESTWQREHDKDCRCGGIFEEVPRRTMNEREFAIELAHKILDRTTGDPDDDLAILARQFLRACECKAIAALNPMEPK